MWRIPFPITVEPTIYHIASSNAEHYNGGYWEFHQLDNDGFYMTPATDDVFHLSCENGFEGDLSADALGITACLYNYSQLSFCDRETGVELVFGESRICSLRR